MNFINEPIYIFIKDLATVILTITGMIIAGKGLITWKKQIKGTKEFEISYNLHNSVLKLRDAIKHVRNPAIWPGESQQAEKYYKEKYPEREIEKSAIKSTAPVYDMRWEEIANASREVESHLLAAEVLWGSEITNKINPLNKKVIELNIAIQQHLEPEMRTKSPEEIDKIIYNHSYEEKKDVFTQEVDKVVKDITDYIKIKIK